MLWISEVKHLFWMYFGRHAIFLPMFRTYETFTRGGIEVVSPSTDIVIEGYPRSANTFAFAAFLLAQERQVRIAHHVHGPAQVIWAARHSLPVLLLIRDPVDAVLSLVMRQPAVSLRQALKDYIRFHQMVYRYHASYVVADFDKVTSDYGRVIRKVNSRFGTSFEEFEHTPENVQRCYELIEEMDRRNTGRKRITTNTVARPSMQREVRKKGLRRQLESENLQEPVAHARAVYHRMRLYATAYDIH